MEHEKWLNYVRSVLEGTKHDKAFNKMVNGETYLPVTRELHVGVRYNEPDIKLNTSGDKA